MIGCEGGDEDLGPEIVDFLDDIDLSMTTINRMAAHDGTLIPFADAIKEVGFTEEEIHEVEDE